MPLLQIHQSEDHLFSQLMACPSCQIALPEMEPRLFSFNAPQGACPSCNGIGKTSNFTEEILCDPKLSVLDGALKCFSEKGNLMYTRIDQRHVNKLMDIFGISKKSIRYCLCERTRNVIFNKRQVI